MSSRWFQIHVVPIQPLLRWKWARPSMQCLSCHLDRIEAADGETVSLLRYYLEDSAATVVDGMALGRILGPRAGETAQ